jgi:polyhydroxybutyrate depolymerase
MRLRPFLAALFLASLAAPLLAAASEHRTVAVDGIQRSYLVHLPPGATGPLPVVLSFHGLGTNAEQQERLSGFSVLADREGFAAVYPQGERNAWRVFGRHADDVRFVLVLIDDLARSLPIDRDRVYATGISNGAQMAWRLACDAPGALAAIGMVAGGYPRLCGDERPPAILFHGTADRLLPYRGRAGQMAVRDFAAGWGGSRGCRADAAQGELLYRNGDATAERWRCKPHDAVLFTLAGKGHSWPGSRTPERITSHDVDASAEMWRFFQAAPAR